MHAGGRCDLRVMRWPPHNSRKRAAPRSATPGTWRNEVSTRAVSGTWVFLVRLLGSWSESCALGLVGLRVLELARAPARLVLLLARLARLARRHLARRHLARRFVSVTKQRQHDALKRGQPKATCMHARATRASRALRQTGRARACDCQSRDLCAGRQHTCQCPGNLARVRACVQHMK